jgi:hypothetical protein
MQYLTIISISGIRICYIFINLYFWCNRCRYRTNGTTKVRLMELGHLILPLFSIALQKSLQNNIKLGLNLLSKLIKKLFKRCRVVDVLRIEGIDVIVFIFRFITI